MGATRAGPELADMSLSQFDDEIPATAPDRDVYAKAGDTSADLIQFVQLLDSVYSMHHDPALMSQAIRGIMQELAENPQYDEQIQPIDVRLIVRTMRATMGMARVQKETKTTTRKASTSKKAAEMDMVAQMMKEMGI